jgi:hypothetical protein
LAGAELRLQGLPSGWTAVASPTPAASVAIGNPVTCGGIVAFTQAQFGECIPLYTVQVTAGSTEENVLLSIGGACTPQHPGYACANVVLPCHEPITVCATVSGLAINGPDPCQVSTKSSTWSAMKDLFR